MSATLLKIRKPKLIRATRYRSRLSRSPMNVRITATIALVTKPEMKIRLSYTPSSPARTEHGVEGGEDGDGRVAAELEADVDVENEPEQHTHQQPCQGEDHRTEPVLSVVRSGKGYLTRRRPGNRIRHAIHHRQRPEASGTTVPWVSSARRTRATSRSPWPRRMLR